MLYRVGGSQCSLQTGYRIHDEHRAEIAHIKPVFKEVELNRGSPMASERKRDTMLVYFEK
jgi:hypothetical protein